jgi:N-succinyl-L-ornithine transcarbamylase
VVSDGVLDGSSSIVVEQAANREITAQAVLKMILEGQKEK